MINEAVAPLWNKAKNGVKISKGLQSGLDILHITYKPPGIAFPTSISTNNVVAHVSPLPSDPEIELKEGDVVKLMLGIQLDGYAVTHAETIHLNSKSPSTELPADVIKAAYDAAQVALRTVKAGGKNWDVTEVVEKVAKDYGCVGVEGMLSCQHEKDVTDGKKRILLNPTPELKREHETCTFEEGEVFGVDVLVVTGTDGKVGSSPILGDRRADLDSTVGQARPISDVNLQALKRHQLSVEDEDQSSSFLRDPKESGSFPIHPEIVGG